MLYIRRIVNRFWYYWQKCQRICMRLLGIVVWTIMRSLQSICRRWQKYRVGQKWGHRRLTVILSNLDYIIPRESFRGDNKPLTINYKVYSVATYWRCGGIVNNQNRKGLLLSLSVNFVKSVNMWKSYKQERDCLVHFLRLLAMCWPGVQSAWDNYAVACNFGKYSPI